MPGAGGGRGRCVGDREDQAQLSMCIGCSQIWSGIMGVCCRFMTEFFHHAGESVSGQREDAYVFF